MQGVALTDDWWFITQVDRLWRFPLRADLTDPGAPHSARSAGIPLEGIDHFGDCDYWEGHLYVAMEGTNPARIGVFDANLDFVGSAPLDHEASNPWCAVDPLTGRLYTSPFDTDHLVAYELCIDGDGINLRSPRRTQLRDRDGVRLELGRIQGGAFTPSGCLYLTSDTTDGGIIGVDVDTGRQMLRHHVDRERGWPDFHIVEGLAYAAVDGCTNIPVGTRLHVLVFTGAWEKPDYLWFRHYRERF